MGIDAENFLKAEETANNLLKTLEKFKNEAKSYQYATNEIALARNELIGLIDSIRDISKSSYEVIELLKKIGSTEIFERINGMERELINSTTNINNNLNEKLSKLENILEEVKKKQSSSLNKITILIVILLIISLATITFLIEPEYLLELKNIFLSLHL